MARSLLAPDLKKLITIVPQERLNGYPIASPGASKSILRAPIMHYPGELRRSLEIRLAQRGFSGGGKS
jgi:hypothetical protein